MSTGATPLRSNPKYYESGKIPWVKSTSLNKPFITQGDEMITEFAVANTGVKIFPSHTLLVAMLGDGKTCGKISELLISPATNQACADGSSSVLRPYVKKRSFNSIMKT